VNGTELTALNLGALAAWLAGSGIAHGEIHNARVLAGGTQNLLLRFSYGGLDLVLRRPPPDRRGSSETVRREAIVLAALDGTAVPHPRFRGLCEDPGVFGGAFLVMDEVRGFNAALCMPGSAASDPLFRHRMGLALVEGIASLAAVPLNLGELRSLGKTEGFIERQTQRWAAQLESYAASPRWPGAAALGPIAEVGAWLDAHRPGDYRPGLMHGDYHIANAMFRENDGELAAIVDWELTALGDPLLDLGRLTTVWPNERNESLLSLKVEPWAGFPPVEELIARYAELTGRSMRSLPWFQVLACYKYAVILEGTHARACANQADAAIGARLHASARGLINRATALLEAA
jgi:aminoglycoside phosphotransferase (APT) family kinase protein